MAAWVAMLLERRKRQTSSTEKRPSSDSATVAGWSVSQNVSMAGLSSFSRSCAASGVNRGWAMSRSSSSGRRARGPRGETTGRASSLKEYVVDEPRSPELDGQGEEGGAAELLDRCERARVDHRGV